MKTYYLLWICILTLGCILRWYQIGQIPNGVYSDEASYAYNAYSLLHTGRDEYGAYLPVGFRSFGDYKAPLYIYVLVPFIWLFGMDISSVRMVSAILGVLSILLTYYFATSLFLKRKVALLSAFMISILPFSLQFQRMAHENTLSLVLLLSGSISYIKGRIYPWYYVLSSLCYVLAMYAYHDARVLVPLFVIFFFFYERDIVRKHAWHLILSAIIGIILLIPLLRFFHTDVFWSRPSNTIFLSDIGTLSSINEKIGEDKAQQVASYRIFHNKLVAFSLKFFQQYAEEFSPSFLLWYGDPVKIYHTPMQGLFLFGMFPLFLFGIASLSQWTQRQRWIIISLMLFAPIPAALTKFFPSASRILFMAPLLSIISAIGAEYWMSIVAMKKIWSIMIVIILTGSMVLYLHMYYVHMPYEYAKEWHYGMDAVMKEVQSRQSKYDTIWFSRSAWGYIYVLFYMKYPPAHYQQQASLSTLNEFGFGWVKGFDKYVFDDIPSDWKSHTKTLYVAAPGDIPQDIQKQFSIQYPDGREAFFGVEVGM